MNELQQIAQVINSKMESMGIDNETASKNTGIIPGNIHRIVNASNAYPVSDLLTLCRFLGIEKLTIDLRVFEIEVNCEIE